jgi:hypothetical protein
MQADGSKAILIMQADGLARKLELLGRGFDSSRELSDPNPPFFDGSDDDDSPLKGRRWAILAGKLGWGSRKGAW